MMLFIPGGPGFSARREAEVLGPMVKGDIRFWEDPWHAGDAHARSWDGYLASLQQFLLVDRAADRPSTVVAHSFAVHPLLIVLQRVAWAPSRLVLVAPVFDVDDFHRRVVSLAARDFERVDPHKAAQLTTLLSRTRSLFDADMQGALGLAAQDPLLFRHYWQDEAAFSGFATAAARPDAQFSPEGFFLVSAGLANHGCDHLRPATPLPAQAVILYGGRDPIVDRSLSSAAAARVFAGVEEVVACDCGHWVHLERPDVFLDAALA